MLEVVCRWDDLQHMASLPASEQQIMALEALQLFAPLGHALGLGAVSSRIEDLCFKVGREVSGRLGMGFWGMTSVPGGDGGSRGELHLAPRAPITKCCRPPCIAITRMPNPSAQSTARTRVVWSGPVLPSHPGCVSCLVPTAHPSLVSLLHCQVLFPASYNHTSGWLREVVDVAEGALFECQQQLLSALDDNVRFKQLAGSCVVGACDYAWWVH